MLSSARGAAPYVTGLTEIVPYVTGVDGHLRLSKAGQKLKSLKFKPFDP